MYNFIKSIRTLKSHGFVTNYNNISRQCLKNITNEKYKCNNCSNCRKIFDCNKFWYGMIFGVSFGYYFSYGYFYKTS
jgi:hypothetical protein